MDNLTDVVSKYQSASIPLEAIWSDLDYSEAWPQPLNAAKPEKPAARLRQCRVGEALHFQAERQCD